MQIDSRLFGAISEILVCSLGYRGAENHLYQMGYRLGESYAPKVIPIQIFLAWKTILEQFFLQNGFRSVNITYEQNPFFVRIQFSVDHSDEIRLLRPWFYAGWCAGYTNSYLGKNIFFQVNIESPGKEQIYILETVERKNDPALFDPYGLTHETRSLAMRICLDRLRDIAYSETPIYLQTEENDQSEYFARYVHQYSERAKRVFIFLDAFTVSDSLFQNAIDSAAHGTLFISTIEVLPIGFQEKLARCLESNSDQNKNIRIIASSENSLAKIYKEQKIIPELAKLLQNHELLIPAIRMRKEDWLPLAKRILDYFSPKIDRGRKSRIQFSASLLHFFSHYDWPGGFGELVSVVKSLLARMKEEERNLELSHLPESFLRKEKVKNFWEGMPLEEMERKYIFSTLEAVQGNKREAARVLQIGYNTLWRKLQIYKKQARTRLRTERT